MKSGTLRIHRGPASPDRVLMVGTTEMGLLSEPVTDFTVPTGHHLVGLKLGSYHSVATYVTLREGATVELTVEENPEAIAPILQGGLLRFHLDSA